MGTQIRVLQKGKVTIPKDARARLGIREGDLLTVEVRGGRIILLPPRTVSNPTGLLCGLAEGSELVEPVKEALRKASAMRLGKKIKRTK